MISCSQVPPWLSAFARTLNRTRKLANLIYLADNLANDLALAKKVRVGISRLSARRRPPIMREGDSTTYPRTTRSRRS
jgi:hypothetical protein